MSLNETILREFFEYVLKGDYVKAKSLIEKFEGSSFSEYEMGYLNAMRGIASTIREGNSNVNHQLDENFIRIRILKFKEILELGNPMIDDYDKGFFECWMKFLRKALEYLEKS
ncbi:MAG: hypothetical protein QXM89_03285 [Candidatus Bathyarchaeia archaeon]